MPHEEHSLTSRAFIPHTSSHHPSYVSSITRPHDTQAIRTEREARSKKLGERHVPLSFAALRIAAGFRAACELGVPEPDAVGIASRGTFIFLFTHTGN